jgi:hypothetical protein
MIIPQLMGTLTEYLEGRVDQVGDCLIWRGAKSPGGYGTLRHQQKQYCAHRFTFMVANGREPEGMVLHSCDTPACVNPDHLSEGTHLDNMREARERNRHPKGEAKPGARLNEQSVRALRYLKDRGYTYKRLAVAYGMSEWTIRSAIKLNWKHV